MTALGVLGDLRVADLDDVRCVVAVECLQHLGTDAAPLLQDELQFDGGMLGLVGLLEAVEEALRGTALHQPHRHRAAVGVHAGKVAAAGQRDGGNERDGSGQYADLHGGHLLRNGTTE